MIDWHQTATRAEALLAHAERSGQEAETGRRKLEALIREIDLELLETLAGQRTELLADMTVEFHRLFERKARPNAGTRLLMERGMMLLRHYEGIDVLPAAVRLERMRAGREAPSDGQSGRTGGRGRGR